MAAPRTVQFIALRSNLRHTTTRPAQIRSLHMTGPATYASPFLSTTPTNPNISKKSTKPSSTPETSSSSRKFNTSRPHKQVNDSSPIDFTFFPLSLFSSSSSSDIDMDMDIDMDITAVPVLPQTTSSSQIGMSRLERSGEEEIVAMKSQVYAVAPDSIILPLSDHASSLVE